MFLSPPPPNSLGFFFGGSLLGKLSVCVSFFGVEGVEMHQAVSGWYSVSMAESVTIVCVCFGKGLVAWRWW